MSTAASFANAACQPASACVASVYGPSLKVMRVLPPWSCSSTRVNVVLVDAHLGDRVAPQHQQPRRVELDDLVGE